MRSRIKWWPAVPAGFLCLAALAACSGGSLTDIMRTQFEKSRLVSGIQVDLLRAVEAEKSAVLSLDDAESRTFAEESRQASAAVDAQTVELQKLVEASGDTAEKDLLASFERGRAELRRLDAELLDLAVQNTNLKAERLWREAAASALARFGQALRASMENLPAGADAKLAAAKALEAQSTAQEIYVLLTRHIVESDEGRMQALEGDMQRLDAQVMALLESLSASASPDGRAVLLEDYESFREVLPSILDLSRRNTNVKSLALSIGKKRLLLAQCLADLRAMSDALSERMNRGSR